MSWRRILSAAATLLSACAILWLTLAGFLIAWVGATWVAEEAARTDACFPGIGCALRQLFLLIDVVGVVFGVAFAAAGIGLWLGRPLARLAGLIVVLLGFIVAPLILGVLLPADWAMSAPDLPTYFAASERTSAWVVPLTVIANGVALAGLVAWEPAKWRSAPRPRS